MKYNVTDMDHDSTLWPPRAAHLSILNGWFRLLRSKFWGVAVPNNANTTVPTTKRKMDGAKSEMDHDSVLSYRSPTATTPTMPGTAPLVFVAPIKTGAYFGDISA